MTTEDKTRKLADHDFIDAAGAVVDEQEKATGIQYKELASGGVFPYQIPGAVAGSPQTMLALFGAKTLATNTASAAKQLRTKGEAVETIPYITDRFAEITEGQWAVAGDGTRGPQIDVQALADAMLPLLRKQLGTDVDRDKLVAKLEADKNYKRAAYGNPDVKKNYMKGKGQDVSIASLAAGF